MNLKGKTALITGASRGIGREIVFELAREGVNISFNYLKNKELALSLEKEILTLGVKVKGYCVDIKDFEAVNNWVKETKSFFGDLDILVNNAGITNDKALLFMTKEDWEAVLSTNLTGVFNTSRAVITGFLKEKKGCIVNISSVSGLIGLERQTNYSAAKAGIIGFSKALAREVASYNIRVNVVCPGFISTDMIKNLKEDFLEKIKEKIILKRIGTPEEVAKVVKFLVSDKASYITGQVIIVDGGLSLNF